jgi:alkanesulfonate monooxygenase SsuD/methylene tetrahydromethanopterin reductase-like flavin-dependent oxidoreductase (luciferase family)
MKPALALYVGGMGLPENNFHGAVYRRMGYDEVVDDVTRLFRSARNADAAEAIPDELVDDAAIVGNADHVREQISAWEAARVTMMVVNARSVEHVERIAALV